METQKRFVQKLHLNAMSTVVCLRNHCSGQTHKYDVA